MTSRIYLGGGILVICAALALVGNDRFGTATEVASSPSNSARIEQALRSPVGCAFIDRPLKQALKDLEKHHHIRIWIDKLALSEEGVPDDWPVTIRNSGIALESALHLMLDPRGLAFVNEDEVLKITSKPRAGLEVSIRVYPVHDLETHYRTLMDAIENSTGGQWMNIDQGGGSITPVDNARSLVIRQSQGMHREIEGLLSAIRRANQLPEIRSIATNPGAPEVLSPKLPSSATASNPAAIERALRSVTKCAFTETPLELALHQLGNQHQIEIWVDRQSLGAQGIDYDQPLSLVASGTPLESVLQQLLDPLKLTFVNDDEVLKIISTADTKDQSSARAHPFSARVYLVRDLVEVGGRMNYRPLMDAIQTSTSGKWMAVDQEGGALIPFPSGGLLVIRHSQQVHREIEGLLKAMRPNQRPSLPISPNAPDVLNPIKPSGATAIPAPSGVQTWQRPKVYSE